MCLGWGGWLAGWDGGWDGAWGDTSQTKPNPTKTQPNKNSAAAHHDGHGVGVMLEALVELDELLVHQRVVLDVGLKLALLDLCW